MRIIAILLLLHSASSFADVNFSDTQLRNLNYAYHYGKQFKHKHKDLGYIYAALAWKETSGNTITTGGKNHKAYGMFQNYLPTVKSRFKQMGHDVSDKAIIDILKKRSISAKFASIELDYWMNVRNNDLHKTLASYNAGWNWQAGNSYATDVIKKAKYLESKGYFENKDG